MGDLLSGVASVSRDADPSLKYPPHDLQIVGYPQLRSVEMLTLH